jgi:AraC-like DNA-binding protein
MEKFVITSDRKDLEHILQEHQFAFPLRTVSNSKGAFIKSLENLSQRWSSLYWNPFIKNRTASIGTETSTIEIKAELSISEKILVPEEIIENLLHQLKVFEKQHGYLDKDVNLPGLAKSLGTNHSYLSRVVNHIKGKSFKQYLNDLRIEYAYIDLQTNPMKRRFTIEAIAFDNGFKSAESFSKKFKTRYGLYPSAFLRKLSDAA